MQWNITKCLFNQWTERVGCCCIVLKLMQWGLIIKRWIFSTDNSYLTGALWVSHYSDIGGLWIPLTKGQQIENQILCHDVILYMLNWNSSIEAVSVNKHSHLFSYRRVRMLLCWTDSLLQWKLVYNDHQMGYFSAFWSSSRWPMAI